MKTQPTQTEQQNGKSLKPSSGRRTFAVAAAIMVTALTGLAWFVFQGQQKGNALTPAAASNHQVLKRGKLSDGREFEMTAVFASAAKEPITALELRLTIAGVKISIPQKAWSDLKLIPDETSLGITDFAGEIKLVLNGSLGERTGVASLVIREDWVASREFTWMKKVDASIDDSSSITKGSEIANFDPPQAPQQSGTIPAPTSTLKLDVKQTQPKP